MNRSIVSGMSSGRSPYGATACAMFSWQPSRGPRPYDSYRNRLHMRLCVSWMPLGSGVSLTIVSMGRQIVDMRVSPSVSLSRGTYSAPGLGTYRVREYEVDSFSRGFAALNTAMSTTCWPSRSVTRRCWPARSEEHTSELQSHVNLVCRLLLE